MESIEDSLKSLCRRVKKSLRLLHGADTAKPSEGGLNESGFKALFQGALAEDGFHVESEFKLGSSYCDLLLTRKDNPFDVAVVVDLKYCATPFIASKHYDRAAQDSKQFEALKQLSVLDICKLKMFWSKGYEAVSVKTVLVAAKKSTNAFAESLLATGVFPFVLSVTVVGIGPCLVTKIETLGRVRPLMVPSPQSLFPHSHSDLARLQARMRQGLASLRSTDGDVDWKHGFKSGLTITGLKMVLLGALHDSSFFVGSAVNMQPATRRRGDRGEERRGRSRQRITAGSRSSSEGSRSRSRSSSSSSSSASSRSSRSRSGSRSSSSSGSPRRRRNHRRSRSGSSSRSRSRSRSRSSSPDDGSARTSSTRTTAITRDGVTYNVRNENLGTIHLLLFNDRSAPSHAVVFHFKYFPLNDVHEWNPATHSFERFGDQVFEQDKLKHKRRLYLSEGLRRMATLSREELERVYVKNPSSDGENAKVDTVGSIARAYTSLAFRQSQAVLEKFPGIRSCTSVSIIAVGSTLLWLQEEVSPTPLSLSASLGQSLVLQRQSDLAELAAKHPRKRGQSEREYQERLRELAKKREVKRRERNNNVRARSVERSSDERFHSHGNGHRSSTGTGAGPASQADLIAILASRHQERQAQTAGKQQRSRSQQRGNKLNRSAYY